MIIYSPPRVSHIPVVDLAGKDAPFAIHKACRETGFFYVANHGVPRELIAGQFEFGRRLFALPLEQRLAIHMDKSPAQHGYDPMEGQALDSQDPNAERAPPDLKEGFYFGMELPDDHPYAKKRLRCFGHNQWPARLPGFREQMLAYQAAARALANRLLSLIALSLELPEDHFVPYYDIPTGVRARTSSAPARTPTGERSPCSRRTTSAASKCATSRATGSAPRRFPTRSSSTSAT